MFLPTGDTSYISSTIIDGDSSGTVVTFENNEDSVAVISGFTIQNGSSPLGGGIICDNSSPTISYNIISGNIGDGAGGGIACLESDPIISKNVISGNTGGFGGGIECSWSNPIIDNNIIYGNTAAIGTYKPVVRIPNDSKKSISKPYSPIKIVCMIPGPIKSLNLLIIGR